MFMRLVQVKAKPEKLPALRRYYEESVIPALQKTSGCLNACLMQSSQHPDEVISMTLWESQEHVKAYESGGLFGRLMKGAGEMLEESSEWRVGLSKDLTLEYGPVPVEPTVTSLPVAAMSGTMKPGEVNTGQMYLRLLSARIKPGMHEEFKSLYVNEVIPPLQATSGCRHAYLMLPATPTGEVISVTIWESKEAAEQYERSGLFSELVEKVKHTFTDLFQWKMQFEKGESKAATSGDLKVEEYTMVAGKGF